jgi:phage terminase large subunit-like protein
MKSNVENSKVVRFNNALLRLYDGKIRIPASLPGLDGFLGELAGFPDAKHDDQVDSVSNVGAFFEKVVWRARLNARGDFGWRRK